MLAAGQEGPDAINSMGRQLHLDNSRSFFAQFATAYGDGGPRDTVPANFSRCAMSTYHEGEGNGFAAYGCKFKTDDGRWLTLQVARFRTQEGEDDYFAKLFGDHGNRIDMATNLWELSAHDEIRAAFKTVTGSERPNLSYRRMVLPPPVVGR